MTFSLTAQQSAFFVKNGFLELEGVLSPQEIAQISKLSFGRDLWRSHPEIKKLLLSRKMGSILLPLLNTDLLTLALDHKFPIDFHLDKPESLKKLVSIQGISFFVFFQTSEPPEVSSLKLGAHPFCKGIGNILIVKPELLIAWPKTNSSVFAAAYSNQKMVYIENPRDPSAGALKVLGYEYGDVLRNETHPLLQRTDYR